MAPIVLFYQHFNYELIKNIHTMLLKCPPSDSKNCLRTQSIKQNRTPTESKKQKRAYLMSRAAC